MGEFDFLNKKNKKQKNERENEKKKSVKPKPKKNSEDKIKNDTEFNFNEEELITDEGFDKFINMYKVKSGLNFGPRPDIKEDHYIWVRLLRIAYSFERETYELLHQFRSCGCLVKLENSKIKIDLENSKDFLLVVAEEDGITDEFDFSKNEVNYTQDSMFGDYAVNDSNYRKKNKESVKKRKKVLNETIKYIKKEFLKPNIKIIGKLFHEFNKKQVAKAEKKIGVGYFNMTNLNETFKRMEEKKKGSR
jgi:hypothetical protein